jgi:hypothetical protein
MRRSPGSPSSVEGSAAGRLLRAVCTPQRVQHPSATQFKAGGGRSAAQGASPPCCRLLPLDPHEAMLSPRHPRSPHLLGAGWQTHPVSVKNWHFIVPAEVSELRAANSHGTAAHSCDRCPRSLPPAYVSKQDRPILATFAAAPWRAAALPEPGQLLRAAPTLRVAAAAVTHDVPPLASQPTLPRRWALTRWRTPPPSAPSRRRGDAASTAARASRCPRRTPMHHTSIKHLWCLSPSCTACTVRPRRCCSRSGVVWGGSPSAAASSPTRLHRCCACRSGARRHRAAGSSGGRRRRAACPAAAAGRRAHCWESGPRESVHTYKASLPPPPPPPSLVTTGTVHSNGFGHLMRLNGREGGSRGATGRQLMQVGRALEGSSLSSYPCNSWPPQTCTR